MNQIVIEESRLKQSNETILFKEVYKKIKFLGEGSFGRVYKVENIKNNRE